MTETNLVMEGLNLMLLGMGIVFSFLIMLVFALKGMSWLAQHIAPEPIPATVPTKITPNLEPESDDVLLAVVAAAVARFRQSQH